MTLARIMVLDADSVESQTLCGVLQNLGYETAIENIDHFKNAVKTEPPDLILMDAFLANEIDIADASIAINNDQFIPIIFLMNESSPASLIQKASYGYLFKPCDEKILHILIETALRQLKLERQIAESKSFYRMVVKESLDAILVADARGDLILANESACKLTGYSQGELLTKNIHDLLSEEDRQNNVYMDELRKGHIVVDNCTLRLNNGSLMKVELHSKILVNGSFQTIIRHLPDKRAMDHLIRESEKRYNALFNQMLDGFALHEIICNAEGLPVDYRFLEMNPAFEQMTGLKAKNTIGKTVLEVLPHTEGYWIERYGKVALGRTPAHFKDYSVELDKYFEVTAYSPRAGQFAVVVVDISDQVRMQKTLEEERALLAKRVAERTADLSIANLQLAKAARMKDEFLANMSHELRTPLTGILGISEALQSHIYGEINERQLKAVQNISDSGAHLLALINDILDFTRIDSGNIELEVMPFSLETACQAGLRLIKQNAQKKQQKIHTNYDKEIGYIMGDEKRIKQILVNLLSNAVKFTPANGDIGIETCGDRKAGLLYITVWDHGIGIDPEDMQQLFAPFVQLDSSLTRHFNGTGLGLSLVLRLVELHGGSISVRSEPGQGSRFTLALPWNEVPEISINDNKLHTARSIPAIRRALAVEDIPEDLEKHRVLLVEDNPVNLSTISDFLHARGFAVSTATNGFEAVEKAIELIPDIIFMDIQMPVMNGLDATRRIRVDRRVKHIPIVALTALAMEGDRERCLRAGANEYLSKPIRLEQLPAIIKNLVLKAG